MRISTNTLYDTGTSQLGNLQTSLAKTQMLLSTGRKNLTAADDPISAARTLEVTQSQSINSQLVTNRQNARSSLSQVELALSGVTSLIQDVQTLAVNAGSGAMTESDRKSVAIELEGRLNDLLGLANTSDGAGGYLFSGYRSTTQPFTQTATGAQYHGDQGQRTLQVGSTRQMPVSDSGTSVFENITTGNGTFTTSADPANTARGGSGIISSGAVADAAALTGHDYSINFTVANGVTSYTIKDETLGAVVVGAEDPVPFQPGQQIAVDGMAFTIKGNPADGDSFAVKPSAKESIFTTLTNMINTLKQSANGAAGQAALTNGLNTAQDNLSSALDNVLSVRASIGARLKELDYLDSAGEDLNLQYSQTLSDLNDLDNVKAISQFSQQQFTLEAAQKSFKTLTGLSLFNFIS
ncbi:flagellar hook-associated protein FlgL [Massilia sp. TS11]|uniref:flagellar hook-associated protein FlgL n=1 Tax=Massilia sp. TS11 TaxID=2908003 RepID=UPI001EDB7F7A|nr:flagellar hook-associated protein FlgL [Massilia sp. TS11]MCG2582865.1 flagellar hook-associated protein FlgL [Massilia sp. TS11]